jgi:hypothetical protein
MKKYLKKSLLTIIGVSVMSLSLGGCVLYGGHGWGHGRDGGQGYSHNDHHSHGHDDGGGYHH